MIRSGALRSHSASAPAGSSNAATWTSLAIDDASLDRSRRLVAWSSTMRTDLMLRTASAHPDRQAAGLPRTEPGRTHLVLVFPTSVLPIAPHATTAPARVMTGPPD